MLHFGAELVENARVEVSLGIVLPELLIVVTSVNAAGAVREEGWLLGPVVLEPRELLVHVGGGRVARPKLLQVEVLKVATKRFWLFSSAGYDPIAALWWYGSIRLNLSRGGGLLAGFDHDSVFDRWKRNEM